MQLYMTSFTGRVEEDMSKNEGFKNWDMNFRTARYDAALPKDKIVYLSSESEQVVFNEHTSFPHPKNTKNKL